VDRPALPAALRGSTRARFRFQRQRAASMGWGSTAWVRHLRRVLADSMDCTLGEREAVLGPEGEHHRVVVRRRLQLEVEGHAEALAQGQPEGAVDATAERRVHDELRPSLSSKQRSTTMRWRVGRKPNAARPAAQ
jgi:hypothetical protein